MIFSLFLSINHIQKLIFILSTININFLNLVICQDLINGKRHTDAIYVQIMQLKSIHGFCETVFQWLGM